LNNDGKPEIVALGFKSSAAAGNYDVTVSAIHIFNGQTGKRLMTIDLPASYTPFGDGYHGSPGSMALIDSDGNRKGEIIFATANTSTTATRKQLYSYEVTETDGVWSATRKWGPVSYSNTTSNTSFSTPVIQIVDFDGDGRAEILAYNKIFDAQTGKLLLTYETLNNDPATTGSAYVGRDFKGVEGTSTSARGNSKIGFASVYDIDGDGRYEICAGGKIYYDIQIDYNATANTGTFKTLNIMDKLPADQKAWLQGNGTLTGINAVRAFTDGRTAVADIDGDGRPEIVVSYYVKTNFSSETGGNGGSENKLRIVAWSADLDKNNSSNSTAELKAILNIPLSNHGTTGTYSYMYIADVDGRIQNGKKLPEISLLGPMFYCYRYGNAWTGYPIHPNVIEEMAASYPRTGGPEEDGRAFGSLISFTWDNTPGLSVFDRLKVSFMMEHSDASVNTGISLFDFDNDGVNEICYRDETSLRIIRPIKPFVGLNDGDRNVTLFKKTVKSNTGFEYPVIVDLDGDYSCDMLVSGSESSATNTYLYAVQGANMDLAPARIVWNQFMYSPMKINDDLTIPQPVPPHPLSPTASFYKDANDAYETPLYNMNIGQTPYYSIFEESGKNVYKPLVKIPDAIIKNLRFESNSIRFTIYNDGEAAMNANTPIKIYDESVSGSTIYYRATLDYPVYPGDNYHVTVPLQNVIDIAKTFIIRVADESFDNNKGNVWRTDENTFKDCDWNTNEAILSEYYLTPDYYTLSNNEIAILDILENDIFTIFPVRPGMDDFSITHISGSTEGQFNIVNNRLQFQAPASGGLIHYQYSHKNSTSYPSKGNIYIYVAELESPNNTLLCDGSQHTFKIKEIPSGVTIKYYDNTGAPINGYPSPFIASISESPKIYYIKPEFTSIPTTYLPLKKIEFKVVPSSSNPTVMKWTGLVNTDWHNPNNWVEITSSGTESSVSYCPSGCVDVLIPSNAPKYPELKASASCNNITMEDRAMIAGIHWLDYKGGASVELKLTSTEKDRFIMWSAPLKSMYSGDYHYTNGSTIQWGDVYMNLFQMNHPVNTGNTADKNKLTATFGELDQSLKLGTAFNLKVTSTTNNRDKSFNFPEQNADSYKDQNGIDYPRGGGYFDRTDKNRFITDGMITPTQPEFNLEVSNDVPGANYIQVVNPFMAYLNVQQFFSNNSSKLANGYAIWNGSIENSFSNFMIDTISGPNRHTISTTPNEINGYIAPLQSFYVKKSTTQGTNVVTNVRMSSAWTSTTQGSPYQLRSESNTERNILRMKATQGNRTSYAVIHNMASASPDYNAKEDMHKIFYDEIGLEVYTLTTNNDALAINSTSNFSGTIPLGLRLRDAGEITLSFEKATGFNQDAYLTDKETGKEINLQTSPSYTFTAAKSNDGKAIELNDRFTLRFSYNPTDNEEIELADDMIVSSKDGYIVIEARDEINSLQIYNVSGALVYNSTKLSTDYRVRVDRQQTYIVKAKIENEYHIEKVFVK